MQKTAFQEIDVGTRPGSRALISRGQRRARAGASGFEAPSHRQSTGFAMAAQQRLDGMLLRCEERYPKEGRHSVLYVVVERDAAICREKLASLHEEFFGKTFEDPLAPVQLEVIDRATDEAVQRMIGAGLLANTTRATRPFWPAKLMAPRPLSREDLHNIAEYRSCAERKVRIASVLSEGGLKDEARVALLEALRPLSSALALERGLPEPDSFNEALLPPHASVWGGALPLLRGFSSEGGPPCPSLLGAVEQLVRAAPGTPGTTHLVNCGQLP